MDDLSARPVNRDKPALPPDPPPQPEIRTVQAVINQASGSTGPDAAAELERIVTESGRTVQVADVPAKEIEARAARRVPPNPTCWSSGRRRHRAARRLLCGPTARSWPPCPGGTMNMLPKAFYGDHPWQEALRRSLDNGLITHVAGGEVNGRTFYVAAILGAPALWAEAREAVRERHLWTAVRRGWRAGKRAFQGGLRFSLDGGPRERAEALSLLCPLISTAMDEQTALEAAAVDPIGRSRPSGWASTTPSASGGPTRPSTPAPAGAAGRGPGAACRPSWTASRSG
jgi:hypothetical protein